MQAAAARVGAPLGHDFCVISLSDQLKPWAVIERRLEAAGAADLVLALYNPASKTRREQLERALAVLRAHRDGDTPVVVARAVGSPDESVTVTTLGGVDPAAVDMRTLLIVGSSTTRVTAGGAVYTPRALPGMRRVSVVGIGAGDPDDITVAAIKALKRPTCSSSSRSRASARSWRARGGRSSRATSRAARTGSSPSRDPERDRAAAAYVEAVEDWRRRRADVWEGLIADELGRGERGAFLVWGDPALYDSTIAVARRDRGARARWRSTRRRPRHQQRRRARRRATGSR